MNRNGHKVQALKMVNYRVLQKPYSQVRAICAELGTSDTQLLRGLREVHQLEFDTLHDDPMLYIVQDTAQMLEFSKAKVNPTFLQLILTSKSIGLQEQQAVDHWFEVMRREDAENIAKRLTDQWGIELPPGEEQP